MKRCAICHSLIQTGDPVHFCPECDAEYHEVCWNEIGGCATYGCTAAAQAEKPSAPVVLGAGWGDEKRCPVCNASISASLLVCACGARFPYAEPMTPAQYVTWVDTRSHIARVKRNLVLCFLMAVLALIGPIVGLISVLYSRSKKDILEGEAGAFLALGYGAGALGAIQALVFLLMAFGM